MQKSFKRLTLMVFLLLAFIGTGCNRQNTVPESPKQEKQVTVTEKQPTWNTQDLRIESNGNLPLAIKLLKGLPVDQMKTQSESVEPALVMKAPWKYYGKILKIAGEVGIAQDYPPSSDTGKVFGGEAGELVMMTEDSTIVDYMGIGGTGDVNIGNKAVVYGFPVGLVEVENKLGGKTTQLVLVGKLTEKATK